MLLLAGAAGGGVAFAVASVPDSSGVIHACYRVDTLGNPVTASSNVYIIDPSAAQSCQSTERALTWSATGPAGAQGPQGPRGPGFTVNTRLVRPSATPSGHIVLGSGKNKLSADILSLGFASAKGKGGGKVTVHDISITKKVDKASPLFFKNCVKGTHYKNETIAVRKAGGGGGSTGTQYLTYKLSNVIISSYQEVSSGGGKSKPEESITLNFSKIVYQ